MASTCILSTRPVTWRKCCFRRLKRASLKARRRREDIQVSTTAFVVTSPEEASFVRQQIAFYASTPSYHPVMALHGWEQVAADLSAMAARGRWSEMPALITDEILETFAVVGETQTLPRALSQRYQGQVDRLALYLPFIPGQRDSFWKALLAAE